MPNGYGGVCRLSGNRRKPFVARKTLGFDEDGRQIIKIIGTYEKRSEALKALAEYNDRTTFKKDYTFKDAYEAYCKEKYTDAGETIPSRYSTPYGRCTDIHGALMQDIKLIHLKKVMENADTPSKKRDLRTLLHQIFEWCIKNEIVEKNPAKLLDNIEMPKSKLHQPFTTDEMKILWKNKDMYGAKLWLIYCYTGLRPGELREIETANVHLDENYMIGGSKNDYSRNRAIPIANCIKPLIEDFYNPERKYLLNVRFAHMTTEKPVSDATVTGYMKEVCDKFNMKHLPHDGRHTCGTMLNDAGVPLLTIQHILGHASNTVTGKVYVHKNIVKMIEAVNKLPTFA